MRAYFEQLLNAGQVRTIRREVDPRFQLAAITQASQRRDEQVILFEKVKGTRLPVVSNIYGSRNRLCDLVGATDGRFCKRWLELVGQLADMNPAAISVLSRDDRRKPAKLSDLPQITYFEKDAGPYFTSAIYLARNPETGVNNLSFHRSMIVSDKELRVRIGSTHDLHHYMSIAEARDEDLPAALLIGVAPELFVAACASLHRDEDELAAAALMRGAPLEMTSCETIDLKVPASTQVVVEGRFLRGERRAEGPFGEFMGYYVPVGDNHVFEVNHVSLAKDPLFHSLLCGTAEDIYPLDLATSARIYRRLSEQLPGILNVACYPVIMNTIIQIEQKFEGHGRQVLLAAMAANLDYSKTCMVVDEDVNIYDLTDVWWAFVTRGRADTRALVIPDMPGFYRDPHKDHWGRLAIDATRPWGRQAEFERKRIPGADGINLDDYV